MASDDWQEGTFEGDKVKPTPTESDQLKNTIKEQEENLRYAQTVINLMQSKANDDFSTIIQIQAKLKIALDDAKKDKTTEQIIEEAKIDNENKFNSFRLSLDTKLTTKQQVIDTLTVQLQTANKNKSSEVAVWEKKFNDAQSEYSKKLSEKTIEVVEKDEGLLSLIENYKNENRDLKNKLKQVETTPKPKVKLKRSKTTKVN